MAKQTNKTNHILNLLSGNGKKKESGDENVAENVAPPVVPRSKTRDYADRSDGTNSGESEPQVIVDVVDEKTEIKENEELVSSINSALEDELKEYEDNKDVESSQEAMELTDDENASTDDNVGFDLGPGKVIDDDSDENEEDFGVLFNGPSVLTSEAENELGDEVVAELEAEPEEELVVESEAEVEEESVAETEAEAEEELVAELEAEVDEESVIEPEIEIEEDEKPLSPDPDVANPAPGYVTLNVMETLVDMMALEYMEKFKICTCDRCLADVKALALTKLAGKYVVVDKEAVQPMINFYEKKYRSDIIVELTKACITIDENPHH